MPMTITSINIFNLIIWFSLSFQQNILEKCDFPYQDNKLRHKSRPPARGGLLQNYGAFKRDIVARLERKIMKLDNNIEYYQNDVITSN